MTSETSFKELYDDLTAALVNTARTAGQIANEDLGFLRTSNPKLARALDKQNSRLLGLARGLIRSASHGTDLLPPDLSNADAVDDEWQRIVDVVDNLLEKADICLDEYTGVIKKESASEHNAVDAKKTSKISQLPNQQRNLAKPQLFFRNAPKNNETTVFKPILRSKPHAIQPLEETVCATVPDNGLQKYPHPYEVEIIQSTYPASVYAQTEPTYPRPFESTTATYVDTIDGVHAMLTELKGAQEIAIDLEHHDMRSYVGIVCLMQISTRERDWIIDTLKPWREDLQVLNEVFADPNIVKVFHGAAMDILWLQRDLGLYVVGLFDTYHASCCLGYPKRSLAFLLHKFVDFDAQKQYQLADWRIRPLTKEMFEYARSDTHFLLYVFDILRNELLGKSTEAENLVITVMEESKKTALQRYERCFYDSELGMGPNGWYQMLSRQSSVYTKEQFSVFKAVHRWRDEVARKEDESVQHVMQNNSLYTVAREMPSEIPQLYGCLSRVSDPVRKRASELLNVIAKAKSSSANGLDMRNALREHPATIEYEAHKTRRHREVQPVPQPTLAEIAKRENMDLSGDQLKAEASSFWGATVNGQKRRKQETPDGMQIPAYSFQLPMPNLTAEVFAQNGDEQFAGTKLAAPPEHPYVKERGQPEPEVPSEEEVFTIREKGGLRKRKASDYDQGTVDPKVTGAVAEGNEIKLTPKALKYQKRNEKRRRTKANKLARKEADLEHATGKENGLEPDAEPEAPFDYTAAPSVLHAKLSVAARAKAPVFDPYKKAMNAPKGLGRVRKEVAGKSATFKK